MGGGHGVDETFTCGYADLHICARRLSVCVYMFPYVDRGFHVCE